MHFIKRHLQASEARINWTFSTPTVDHYQIFDFYSIVITSLGKEGGAY